MIDLHELLDSNYGQNGGEILKQELEKGKNPNSFSIRLGENLLQVAVRRRRLDATVILHNAGADLNYTNRHGKTAYAHAIRRGFTELVEYLVLQGANSKLNIADQFAIAVTSGQLNKAKNILSSNPSVIKTGNPGEDRLLADMAGRFAPHIVSFLIDSGADLTCPALDDGTALHQSAWFGQPENTALLIKAGAPLEIFDKTHFSSPLGWAVHGSRYSGGAEKRQEIYISIVKMLLDAGSRLEYPTKSIEHSYKERLMKDASKGVSEVLVQYI